MEIWKDIKGFEGFYQVSSLGNVRSVEREIIQKHSKGHLYTRVMKSKILRPIKNNKGYKRVTLSTPNKSEKSFVHRLVALHFLNNPKDKPQVNHINGDKLDNSLSNLEWVTGRENYDHAINLRLERKGRNV